MSTSHEFVLDDPANAADKQRCRTTGRYSGDPFSKKATKVCLPASVYTCIEERRGCSPY